MPKLYFYYSAMNAGKSTMLLQSAHNYNERGMGTLLFTAAIDNRSGDKKIASRIGLSADAVAFDDNTNLFEYCKSHQTQFPKLHCVLVDEAQFLNKKQVFELSDIVDKLNLPVLAYGIRSDFQAEPFEGSKYLLVLADNLVEIKTVCICGKKATMNTRIDTEGNVIRNGTQIQIGGNDNYIATCRKHFKVVERFAPASQSGETLNDTHN